MDVKIVLQFKVYDQNQSSDKVPAVNRNSQVIAYIKLRTLLIQIIVMVC